MEMQEEKFIKVLAEDDGQRLDRWLKKYVPELPFGLSQKLIRKGAIKIDRKKAKNDTRLEAGQEVRIPPIESKPEKQKREIRFTKEDKHYIRSLVIYDDDDIVAFHKPSGLASQGGGGVERHIDKYFPILEKNEMKPRLIHRLDRDTSGVLLAARSPEAVRRLGKSFKERYVKKIYWAVTMNVPPQNEGTIKAPLIKASGAFKDKMVVDDKDGKSAITDFIVLDKIGKEAALVAFWPRTGRTHQIRVHCSEILNCPILGDEKYGGKADERFEDLDISDRLHLHAGFLSLRHPMHKGKTLELKAQVPPEILKTMQALGLSANFDEKIFDTEK